jgi:exosortase C (VPDSG-CTERM-specific)
MNPQPIESSRAVLIEPVPKTGVAPFRLFLVLSAVLLAAFSFPLYKLVRHALEERSLYSHVLLIPFVSGYFIWLKRNRLAVRQARSLKGSIPFAILGVLLLIAEFVLRSSGHNLSTDDTLSFKIGSFVALFVAITFYALGPSICRQIAFPLAFLVFIVPFPDAVTSALENASKHGSAETYAFFMKATRMSYFRDGMVFALPGLSIEVAQECSGIRSSLVLFITSLMAGYVFLSKPRNRALLAFIVLPLGILRNAFRIYVLSFLTIHWDPRVIDSPLHHRGGPLFFALSLIPFLLLLGWLVRSEKLLVKENRVHPVC